LAPKPRARLRRTKATLAAARSAVRHPWKTTRHHYVGVTIAALYVVIATSLTDAFLYPIESAMLIELGCMAVVIIAFIGGRQHAGPRDVKVGRWTIIPAKAFGGNELPCCDLCLLKTWEPPIDPAATVKKKMRQLKLVHQLNDVWKWWAIIVYLAVDYATCWAVWHFVSIAAAILVSNLFVAGFIYVMMAIGNHTRLQGWCPLCRNGGNDVAQGVTPALDPQIA
jgi:hypothetical protein